MEHQLFKFSSDFIIRVYWIEVTVLLGYIKS